MGQTLKLPVAYFGSADSSFRAVAKGEIYKKVGWLPSFLPQSGYGSLRVKPLTPQPADGGRCGRRLRRLRWPRPPAASTRCRVSVDRPTDARTHERADPNVHCPWPRRRRTADSSPSVRGRPPKERSRCGQVSVAQGQAGKSGGSKQPFYLLILWNGFVILSCSFKYDNIYQKSSKDEMWCVKKGCLLRLSES